MTTAEVLHRTPEDMRARRTDLLASVNRDRASLYRDADRYDLTPAEWDVYENLQMIDSLLGED